jgi:hypothetical protein
VTGKRCPRCGETRALGRHAVCVPCAAACGWDPECVACGVEDRGGVAEVPHVATCDPGMRARAAICKCPVGLCRCGHSPGDRFRAGRRTAAERILARARALQADMDGDPDLAADPMVAGEIEGLWAAARIADERTWEQSGWRVSHG